MNVGDEVFAMAMTQFIVRVVVSAACYALADGLARLHSSEPRAIYSRRIVLMTVALGIWWLAHGIFDLSAFFTGNSANPHDVERRSLWMAKQLGADYGVHAIWAWCIVALIHWPEARKETILKPASA